jgi:hypothetical protein
MAQFKWCLIHRMKRGGGGKRSVDAVQSSGQRLHGGRVRAVLGGCRNQWRGRSPASVRKEEEGLGGPSG